MNKYSLYQNQAIYFKFYQYHPHPYENILVGEAHTKNFEIEIFHESFHPLIPMDQAANGIKQGVA